jgi:hypothetical protein
MPVTDGADIIDGPIELPPESGNRVFSYRVMRRQAMYKVAVLIPIAIMLSPPNGPGGLAAATQGRSALDEWLAHGQIPERITVDAFGSGWGDPVTLLHG